MCSELRLTFQTLQLLLFLSQTNIHTTFFWRPPHPSCLYCSEMKQSSSLPQLVVELSLRRVSISSSELFESLTTFVMTLHCTGNLVLTSLWQVKIGIGKHNTDISAQYCQTPIVLIHIIHGFMTFIPTLMSCQCQWNTVQLNWIHDYLINFYIDYRFNECIFFRVW